ncbi:hypothetical protein GUJ93_ZPchr0008g13939 [Zizania palustris]|uniref:Uncharacterized protein n=1 Tax=Zizania palustris TaxID=103762 RepID=A0A8J5R4H7_ZIZPA|nr:hypothetical protein GUJ93_ZPchr0008g13939 [Zizania palustris]
MTRTTKDRWRVYKHLSCNIQNAILTVKRRSCSDHGNSLAEAGESDTPHGAAGSGGAYVGGRARRERGRANAAPWRRPAAQGEEGGMTGGTRSGKRASPRQADGDGGSGARRGSKEEEEEEEEEERRADARRVGEETGQIRSWNRG